MTVDSKAVLQPYLKTPEPTARDTLPAVLDTGMPIAGELRLLGAGCWPGYNQQHTEQTVLQKSVALGLHGS